MMRKPPTLALLALACAAAGCGAGPGKPVSSPDGGPLAGPVQPEAGAGTPSTGGTSGAGLDGPPIAALDGPSANPDLRPAGASPSDGRPLSDGASPSDGQPQFTPQASCNYQEGITPPSLVSCGGAWTGVRSMVPAQPSAMCPEYRLLLTATGGRPFLTLQDAAAALGCDPSCVYQPRLAVDLLRCGSRASADRWSDGAPGQTQPAGSCRDLFQFVSVSGSGWYYSLAEATAANPCPTDGGQDR
jgi:hypothetical protein